MTGNNKKERQPLSRLVEALVEDILAASDEEILAEEAEAGADPAKTAAAMQALFEKRSEDENAYQVSRDVSEDQTRGGS